MTSRAKSKQAKTIGEPKHTVTPKNTEKRRDVIRAAYQTLAEKGFEGLRMREIAKRAGMDHATLHYYYAGKEALIHEVLDYIVLELSLGRSAATDARGLSPRRRLAAHFEALMCQARERPEMFVVLAEINARSLRDPVVRSVVVDNDRRWRGFLVDILKEGVREREFSARLGPEAAADAVLSMVRGLTVTFAGKVEDMERSLRQLSVWLEAK